ncbi:MAG: hypothetical protein M3320_02125 [Actinomycetota bacterium]|nr:hypothetical protein [Actinomycetota bacterium]
MILETGDEPWEYLVEDLGLEDGHEHVGAVAHPAPLAAVRGVADLRRVDDVGDHRLQRKQRLVDRGDRREPHGDCRVEAGCPPLAPDAQDTFIHAHRHAGFPLIGAGWRSMSTPSSATAATAREATA